MKDIYAVASKTRHSGRRKHLRPNIIGIVGGIIAFISLALPWWMMTVSASGLGIGVSVDVSIYPYQAMARSSGYARGPTIVEVDLWYGWVALVLVVIGGLLGIVGSLVQSTRMILAAGGLLALLSTIVFAVGLQNELLTSPIVPLWPLVGLFSSGNFAIYANYTTYLSFGFWLALVAAIIMLVASRKKPEIVAPLPPQ